MGSSFAVVRAIGTDRIGVVDDVTSVVEQASCNIEESKMSVLGGEFAVMMLVSGTEAAIRTLVEHDFSRGALKDFSVDVIPTKEPQAIRAGVPYEIETVSIDSPGIVHAVTSLLARERRGGPGDRYDPGSLHRFAAIHPTHPCYACGAETRCATQGTLAAIGFGKGS